MIAFTINYKSSCRRSFSAQRSFGGVATKGGCRNGYQRRNARSRPIQDQAYAPARLKEIYGYILRERIKNDADRAKNQINKCDHEENHGNTTRLAHAGQRLTIDFPTLCSCHAGHRYRQPAGCLAHWTGVNSCHSLCCSHLDSIQVQRGTVIA